MFAIGKEVAFMYARVAGAILSLEVQVYAMVDVAEAGECAGYTQGSTKEAFDEVRVRLGTGPYG
jgi:hypothetical protein